MGLRKKIFGNVRKPEGFTGKLVAQSMNSASHRLMAEWAMRFVRLNGDERIADLGCGGGGNVKKMLEMVPDGHVTGLDYSAISVSVSRKKNKKEIEEGRCEIVKGNVMEMPFGDATFDMATAFETVYFWPDLEVSFREVLRVLKPGGSFLIINDADGKNVKDLKREKIVDGMKIYTADQLKEFLFRAGFMRVEIVDDEKLDKLRVTAFKA